MRCWAQEPGPVGFAVSSSHPALLCFKASVAHWGHLQKKVRLLTEKPTLFIFRVHQGEQIVSCWPKLSCNRAEHLQESKKKKSVQCLLCCNVIVKISHNTDKHWMQVSFGFFSSYLHCLKEPDLLCCTVSKQSCYPLMRKRKPELDSCFICTEPGVEGYWETPCCDSSSSNRASNTAQTLL